MVIDTAGPRAAHVIEPTRRRDANTIEDKITMEDPKAFTKPRQVVRAYIRKPGWEIAEFVCLESQRNPPNADGMTGTVLLMVAAQ